MCGNKLAETFLRIKLPTNYSLKIIYTNMTDVRLNLLCYIEILENI